MPILGCSDLSGFPTVDHAIFANASGPRCDAGVWDGTADGRNQVSEESDQELQQQQRPLLQVFKQASCVPDVLGRCPTSILIPSSIVVPDSGVVGSILGPDDGAVMRIPDSEQLAKASGSVKLWVRCGKTCFRKDVNFGPGEVRRRLFLWVWRMWL